MDFVDSLYPALLRAALPDGMETGVPPFHQSPA